MPNPRAILTTLAEQTAAQIGFTLRRWWREKTEPAVLRVEVERRLVGAPPAIAVLTVPIPLSPSSRPARPAPATAPTPSRVRTPPRRQTTGARRPARARTA